MATAQLQAAIMTIAGSIDTSLAQMGLTVQKLSQRMSHTGMMAQFGRAWKEDYKIAEVGWHQINLAQGDLSTLIQAFAGVLMHFGHPDWIEWLLEHALRSNPGQAKALEIPFRVSLSQIGDIGPPAIAFSFDDTLEPNAVRAKYVDRLFKAAAHDRAGANWAVMGHADMAFCFESAILGFADEAPNAAAYLKRHKSKILGWANEDNAALRSIGERLAVYIRE